MTEIHTCMLLAAGLGSRLKPLTDTMPKPLVNVGGMPVIMRSLLAIKSAGIKRVVINTHYFANDLERTVTAQAQGLGLGLQIYFSREDELLETGGGIKNALPMLGDKPFLVVNSDAVWLEDDFPLLKGLMHAFDGKAHDVLMAVVPTTNTGDFRTEGGDFKLDKKTHKMVKPADRKKADVVYTGIHITHPAFIAHEADTKFSLVRPWAEAAAAGRLHGYLYKGPWIDMGSHTGLEAARELVRPRLRSGA